MAWPATDTAVLLHPVALALAAGIAAVGTAIAIAYARRRNLVDAPGARRSHRVATPRGGGIAIVAATVLVGLAPLLARDSTAWASTLLALVAVAAIGWLDDHRPLPALPRLAVHLVAAGLVVFAMPFPTAWGSAIAILAIAWSVNLHNFMDGIDGLLAMQAAFVLTALAFALASVGALAPAHAAATAGAATLGFLGFNAPRAKIFMGDVGSGALGLLVGAASLWAVRTGALDLPGVLVLGSAFTIDATATLVSRAVRGRRWWSAHREHLYQWLARSGGSHARVVLAYLGWNVLIVLPALALARVAGPGSVYSWIVAAVVHALGLAIWFAGKRRLLRRDR